MTDQEKLQRLFDAALRDSSEIDKTPTRLLPKTPIPAARAIPVAESVVEIQPEPSAQEWGQTVANLGLDEQASSELATLLEAQNQRTTSKRRRDAVITLVTCIAMVGGGFGWFVKSPERLRAFREAMTEVRSAGDVGAILANYQKAVDRIGARSNSIDEATESMGVSSNQDDAKDPNLEAEMLAMTGGEGKSVGQRNQLLQEKFGKIATAARTGIEQSPVKSPTP